MSLADIMNFDRIIEVGAIITTTHTYKNGDTTYNHVVDENGHFHLVSADGTKLMSYNTDNTMNTDCLLNQDIGSSYWLRATGAKK